VSAQKSLASQQKTCNWVREYQSRVIITNKQASEQASEQLSIKAKISAAANEIPRMASSKKKEECLKRRAAHSMLQHHRYKIELFIA